MLETDAVLAGDRAAGIDAQAQDLAAERQHALGRARLSSSNMTFGWRLPSPAWKTLPQRKPVARARLLDAAHHHRAASSSGTTPSRR
ncbi:MAG: hypothetical protein U0360_10580 [Dehalococcoidia bacterium]